MNKAKIIIIIVLTVLVGSIWTYWKYSQPRKVLTLEEKEALYPSRDEIGKTVLVNDNNDNWDSCYGVTAMGESVQIYQSVYSANDAELKEMMGYGKIFAVENCEDATLIDVDNAYRKVKVSDVDGNERMGWTLSFYLIPKQ